MKTVIHPTASLAEPVSTSASSLPTIQLSRSNQSPEIMAPKAVAQIPSDTSGSEVLTLPPPLNIQEPAAKTVVIVQQPSSPMPAAPADVRIPALEQIQNLQNQLKQVIEESGEEEEFNPFRGSPGLTIANPIGFGADNNTVFIAGSFQEQVRRSDESDGGVGVGVGLFDSRETVGLELSYTSASFGGSRGFGAGGFNAKVHRQLPDDVGVAVGWNGFAVTDETEFDDSIYGVVTKVFRTRDNLNQPFSRFALTAGLGTGQFRPETDFANDVDSIGIFVSGALRVARPVSVIAEWTGQDVATGVSVGFKITPSLNVVVTPAVRDIIGAGDGPRFVLGMGLSYGF